MTQKTFDDAVIMVSECVAYYHVDLEHSRAI
jgi:hypothetical protein